SGSMRQKRPEVITAALVFIQASNPLDETFVVNFNDDVKFGLPTGQPFSASVQQLRSALWMGDPDGRTRLYDAISAALTHLEKGQRGRKALIVVSDGGDNYSRHNFPQTLRAVEESRATVYTVGVFDEDDPDRNPGVLEKLSSVSGGVSYLPKTLSEVPDVCRQIARDIRSRYTVGYIPPNAGQAGQRRIRVEVSSTGAGKLIARTRRVYIVPGQTVEANSKSVHSLPGP
ncbi:MAG: VWA domain-containing protein, partial [Bryobacteraceae bacterium]